MRLFELEVPEESLIEIRAAARDPGIRQDRGERTIRDSIHRDRVSACAARVTAVTNELAGERVGTSCCSPRTRPSS